MQARGQGWAAQQVQESRGGARQGAGRRASPQKTPGSPPSAPAPVVSARRHLEDPQWQGRYLEFVSKFQLQEAPVFNLDDPDGECWPPAVSPSPRGAGPGGAGERPLAITTHARPVLPGLTKPRAQRGPETRLRSHSREEALRSAGLSQAPPPRASSRQSTKPGPAQGAEDARRTRQTHPSAAAWAAGPLPFSCLFTGDKAAGAGGAGGGGAAGRLPGGGGVRGMWPEQRDGRGSQGAAGAEGSCGPWRGPGDVAGCGAGQQRARQFVP